MRRVDNKLDSFQAEVNGRFDSMQRTMLFTGIVASIITAILAG